MKHDPKKKDKASEEVPVNTGRPIAEENEYIEPEQQDGLQPEDLGADGEDI